MQQHHRQSEASAHENKASPSPSFSSYSSETLAEIAARVIEELRHSVSEDDEDEALFPPWEKEKEKEKEKEEKEEARREEKEEFEFALVWGEVGSPVSADDIFSNGQIKPMYPIFGFPPNGGVSDGPSETRRRLPLGKLMSEEGETASCSSSTDESVDLEVEGAYCVWTPNSVARERERKKSNSTGSASKRWKFRDLLLRSHSEGKNKQQQQQPPHVPFHIPTPKPHNGTNQNNTKSFLPHRPQLVGLFTNVNGLGRNFRPF